MKRFAAIFLPLLLLAKTALAEDINDAYLIGQLSGYFKDYYESINQDKMPPYEGKEIGFTIKVINNLEIRDFTYVLTKGREALDVGTRGAIICYNLEAYKMRANSIWDFFRGREDNLKNKRYDPSKSNRLRKWLYHKTWHTLAGNQQIYLRTEKKLNSL